MGSKAGNSTAKQGILYKFKHQPIQKQFAVITGAFLAIILILSILLFASIKNIFLQNQQNYADMYSNRFSNELDNVSFQLEVLGNDFQNSAICKELLSKDKYSQFSSDLIDEINNKVASVKSLNSNIADIAFVNDTLHMSSIFSEEDLENLYESALSDQSITSAMGLHKSSIRALSAKTYYIYCYKIYQKGNIIGCVFISLDIENLIIEDSGRGSASSDSLESKASSFFLMDSNGNAYPLDNNSELFTDVVLDFCQNYISDPSRTGQDGNACESYTYSDNNYVITLNYSEKSGCYIISSVYVAAINNYLIFAWRQIIIILIAILIFSLLLVYVFFKSMVQPINKFSGIISKMTQDSQRHLPEPIVVDGCAEVQDLTESFSTLFAAIDELNKKIFDTTTKLYEEKIRGQATEISYFRSQINPHFLYNVLEQIKSLALYNNVPEIASIAVAMGKMYKYNAKGDPIVPFRNELEMTKAYIEIQKYRFKDKFEIIYNVPDEALDIPVIKIILQPIIENAIQHGIEPALHDCMLYIGCNVTKDLFTIEIRDDGVGISKDKLKELQDILDTPHYEANAYVGIYNTNARLKLQYGPEYGITIDSQENDGTVVTIKMPVRNEKNNS